MLLRRSTVAILSVLLSGCSEQVIVIDTMHRPIAGAAVRADTETERGDPELTDKTGRADVSLGLPWSRTKLIGVSKQGFRPIRTPLPDTWPLIVLMSAQMPSREEIWVPLSQPASRSSNTTRPASGRGPFLPQ